MRKTLAALFLVLTAAVGTFAVPAPARAAQTSDAKVVIIVGATHGATSDYRSKADQAYAEAIKYTPNVVEGLQPERDLVEGQERHGRRVGGHLLRPRERLAQPVP